MMLVIFLLLVNVAFLPAGLVAIGLSRTRADRWECDSCGYDLRGMPAQSDICPECGHPASAGASVRRIHFRRPILSLGLALIGIPLLCDVACVVMILYYLLRVLF